MTALESANYGAQVAREFNNSGAQTVGRTQHAPSPQALDSRVAKQREKKPLQAS
jgi:hypothetical protein